MKLILKLAFSASLIGATLYVAGAAPVWAALAEADLRWLGVAAFCLISVTVLMARRWQLVAQSLGLDLTYGLALREYFLSGLINQILPGGVLGDASRAIRLRHAGDLKRAAKSVLLERLIGQIFLWAVMAVGFMIALLLPGGLPLPLWIWVVLVGLIALFGLAYISRFPLINDAVSLLRRSEQTLISGLITALLLVSFAACARGVGAVLPGEAILTLIPLILSAMIIPLSIGGWGWREGAAAMLFPLAGLEASLGVATGIAYGGLLLLTALPAMVFLVWVHTGDPVARQSATTE
ncbi:MAG: YbhN family protein [Paracoccaceae bacterium]